MNSANPYAPPRAIVSDVGAVESEEIELASRGLRLGAAILDWVIANVIVSIPAVIGTVIKGGGSDELMPLDIALLLVGWVPWLAITWVLVARNGQTIAKKLLNIKVVRTDGSKASVARIFWLRNFVPNLLWITLIFPLIDKLFIFSDSKQCLHDKIADTIVVNA